MRLEITLLIEIRKCLVDGAENFVGGLGDEGAGVFFGFPDDVDVFGVFVGVLEFAFDAAGEAGLAGGEFGDEGDDHVGLADEHEISGVDLAVDVGDDLEEVGGFEVDGAGLFEGAGGADGGSVEEVAEVGLGGFDGVAEIDGEGLFALLSGADGEVGEDFFVDVAGVEGDHFFGDAGAEVVDFAEGVGEVHDVGHGEGGVDGFHVGAEDEAVEGLGGHVEAAAGEDEKFCFGGFGFAGDFGGASDGAGEDFGGEDFLFAPDHEVFEGVFEVVVAHHALVDGFDVVDEGDVEVGVEGGELVEVEGGEEAVLPAEGGVGVDDDVFVVVHIGEDVAEDGSS